MSENLYTAFIGLCVFSALVVAEESLRKLISMTLKEALQRFIMNS